MAQEKVTEQEYQAAKEKLNSFGLFERLTFETIMTWIEQGLQEVVMLRRMDRATIETQAARIRELERLLNKGESA